MSPTERITIPCPQCRQPVEVKIWQILDFGRQPDLRWRFLQDQLNVLHCASCGATGLLAKPFVVHDPAQEQVIFFIPNDPQITPTLFQQIQRQLSQLLLESIPDRPPDYIFSPLLCRDPAELTALLDTGLPPADPSSRVELPPELARLLAVLTSEQREMFLSILQNASDEASFNRELAKYPELMAELQRTLLSSASQFPAELEAIQQQLSKPDGLNDMSRRVELCWQALKLVHREQQPQLWAILQNELGISLTKNPLGSRAENLEWAIQAYQQALTVPAAPVDWAGTMNNLGLAYYFRIRGERAENLERAIEAYQQALTVRTREAMPVAWAGTMNNLGPAYYFRIRGERAENLERAIETCQQALTVQTRETLPVEWANTLNSLAVAYTARIRGERAENLERAIEACQQALTVRTYETLPVEWAETMNNLALAYTARIRGERAENLERAIEAYQQALTVQTRETLPVEWAGTMNNLALAYTARIRGERAENIERAIEACQQALTVQTRETLPVEWATSMNNLATAYGDRIRGERAENLERAIEAYQQALTVRTREAMPRAWAVTMNSLATVYCDRIQGERAENLERAIETCQQALTVQTRETLPVEWAITMNNLATIYAARIRGERAENLEGAIEAYEQALTVQTREALPVEWATTMNSLANAYADRIWGERAENLERAIEAYEQALTVQTRETLPVEWATTMNNLATVYRVRIRGERAENIERAIQAYQQALTVQTREALPVEWATTMNNLANAYADRIWGERAENLERAIEAYEQALTVQTREAIPIKWAQTMNNLATTYVDRIRGEEAENIERAITAFEQALTVITREILPVEWATTMNNLATSYRDRTRGERAENIGRAIQAYQQALTIQTITWLPADHRKTQRNLAKLYFREQCWTEAAAAYQAAIAAGQLLLATAYTESGRQAEVAETAQLYAQAAYCQLRSCQLPEALLTLEQGKTRLLAESLALTEADIYTLSEERRQALITARKVIRTLEAEMHLPPDTPARRDERELAAALGRARTDFNQLIATVQQDYPDFMPSNLSLSEILALVPPGGALVAPLITSQGSAVFVIPHGAKTVEAEYILWLDEFKDDNFQALLVGSESEPGWLRVYLNFRRNLPAWLKMVETTGQSLWSQLAGPIYDKLTALGVVPGVSLLLMPQGGLGLLPLHAAWREVAGIKRAFLDDYTITYAPSGYTLSVSRRRLQEEQRRQRSVLAVVNPTQDLTYTPVEGEAVMALFDPQAAKLLVGEIATPEAVHHEIVGYSYLHFSCHGFYNWEEAMQSGLVLAGSQPLTLADIIAKLDLSAARLVTLSACETGLTEFRQSPDEYLGLPAGFLQAGAPGVVSTLWAVDDLSSMLLMERFYRYHLREGMEIATALRQAQLWLRDVTAGELSKRFSEERQVLMSSTRMPAEVVIQQFRRFAALGSNERPFAHPFYWAAFTFYGA